MTEPKNGKNWVIGVLILVIGLLGGWGAHATAFGDRLTRVETTSQTICEKQEKFEKTVENINTQLSDIKILLAKHIGESHR